MNKDFDKWNIVKKHLEENDNDILFKDGEVWWCSIGINIKTESCGKGGGYQRPVLILKRLSMKNFIGIPLSTQRKIGSWFMGIQTGSTKSYILLYQIRMFSSVRLYRRLYTLNDNDLRKIKEKLKLLLELS